MYDTKQFPKLSGIYKITNLLNNKCYIGSAVNLKLRLNRHYYELKNNIHNNKYLQKTFNKNTVENFNIEILNTFEYIEYSELLKIEKDYILEFNSIEKGYNLMLDNSEFFKKLNISKKHIENNIKKTSKPVLAINITTGLIENKFNSISEASRFFKTSSSNISRICKNKLNYIKGYTFCYENEYDENKDYKKSLTRKGIKHSENHRKNIEKAIQNYKGVKVYKYDLDYNFIEEYPSKNFAEIKNNLKKESLRWRLDNKTPFEGFYWLSTKN
jgi:group I intron endonuclease